jgi:hypothetical protein
MRKLVNLLVAQFKLYQFDVSRQMIEEISSEVEKMSEKYLEINTLNYNYLQQEEKTVKHVLQDGTDLMIDNLEWIQTDDYTIVVMYLNDSPVKNMFYVLDPAYTDYIIKETIFLFIMMSKYNNGLDDETLLNLHHVIIATLIAMCCLAKYDMGQDQFDRMVKIIDMDTICITLCLPLLDILNNNYIYHKYLQSI